MTETFSAKTSLVKLDQKKLIWHGEDCAIASFAPQGDPSRIGRCTVLTAQTLFLLESNGRFLRKGHYPGPGKVSQALAVLLRVLSPGVPEVQPKTALLFGRVSDYVRDRIVDSLRDVEIRTPNPLREFEELRELLTSKPESHSRSIIQFVERVGLEGMLVKDRYGYFVKAESSYKAAKPSADVRVCTEFAEGSLKNRGIYPMNMRDSFEHARLLAAISLIYSSPILSKFHIKGKTAAQISLAVADVVCLESCLNTDYSSFEASITGLVYEAEQKLFYDVLVLMGFGETAEKYKNNRKAQRLYSGLLSFDHKCRASGDYETAGGNLYLNLLVYLTGDYVVWCRENGSVDLNAWWVEAAERPALFEGDDAVVPEARVDSCTVGELGFAFSTAECSDIGSQRLDFLRVAHHSMGREGFRVVNCLRSLRSFQLETRNPLRFPKLAYMLRVTAWSVWCSAPGHPILWAAVRVIERKTRGYAKFKGWQNYVLKNPHKKDFGEPPDRFPRTYCDERLRVLLAESVNPSIPAVSIPEQHALEKLILDWDFGRYIPTSQVFSDYPEFEDMASSPGEPVLEIDGTEDSLLREWLERMGAI